MNDKYAKAYQEVIEILKFVPPESVEKIPSNMIQTFKMKRDKNHNFTVDVNKSFEEQKLLEETKDIFAILFRDYWATPYQREKILAKEKYDTQRMEIEKQKKYNPDIIFQKNTKERCTQNVESKTNDLPVEYQEKFYQKILKFFKKLFKI